MYKFFEDKEYYTCQLTYEQYKNFKELQVVEECKILKRDEQEFADYRKEMQNALDLAAKNDTSHIKKLSESLQI